MLGIPTAGTPATPFVQSLKALEMPAGIDAFERTIVTGNFIPAERDVLLERAIAWNADVTFMCDDDMVLPPDTLTRLLSVLEADPSVGVSGALYYSRDGLRPMVVDGWDASDVTRGWIPAFDDHTPVSVAGIGFGCVAIRMSVVEPLARPFFPCQVYIEPAAGRVRICNEDYLFCGRVREAGYGVVLHPGVRCGHYDRTRDTIAPVSWEAPDRSNVKRILTRTGDSYAMMPLNDTSENAPPGRCERADVTYVYAGEST
jgi:Glycosyltransferase like family 2